MIRFHLDEHVDHEIARGLRSRGVDVTTSTDANLLGAPDEAHLEFARGENRVIFTSDADFLRLASRGEPHVGIAYCAPAKRSIGEVVRYLCLMNDCLEPEEMAGRIEFL
ncbi:MAG TPA: DUF5615 family PIN-like protein [Pirellulaceae bacterium]|nr:DUF5615 family PIN-like protein [Pirellulaceae bacterium]